MKRVNSCYLDIAALDSYDRRLQDALSRLNILKNTLSDICDIYEMYDKKVFVNYDMGNLYAETSLHETTTFRLVVGTGAIIGILAVSVLCPACAISTGAVISAAKVAAIVGLVRGVTSVCNGEDFLDGFADGYMWGAISGALGAVVGGVAAAVGGSAGKTGATLATHAVMAVGDGAADTAIYAGKAALDDEDVTIEGIAMTWVTGALLSAAGQSFTATGYKPIVQDGEEVLNLNSQFRREVPDVVDDGVSSKMLTDTIGDTVEQVVEGGSSFKYMEQLDNFSEKKINHMINGSKNSNHSWEKLVPDKNWSDIKNIVNNVMDNGVEVPYKSVFSKKMTINGYEVEVTYNKLADGAIKISDAWINP